MPVHRPPPVVPAASGVSRKRDQILAAARELFLADGYGAVSMDAVARRAGVSKATLYAHFDSKHELFVVMTGQYAIADLVAEELFALPTSDVRGSLDAVGRTVLRFLLCPQTLALVRIAIAEAGRFPELGQAFYARGPQRFWEQMREWIAAQQAAGRVRSDAEPGVAAEQFGALLRCGLFMRATLGLPPPPSDAEIDRTVAAAVETWLRAYAV